MKRLKQTALNGVHFNVKDLDQFNAAVKLLKESLFEECSAAMFCADNLITWNRNLSFLRDPFYLKTLQDPNIHPVEKSIVWRSYILLYFVELSKNLIGDFLECGCHTGFTATEVIKKVDFLGLKKRYFLYDLFEWNNGDQHTLLEGHKNPRMYEDTVDKFAKYPFVQVVKGSVPSSFEKGFPEQIAFAHIDMNHPLPEAGALERILPRLSQGGVIVFDDYGWWGYSAQKIALDPIAERHGQSILELPTGQGLLIKT